jgi:hypothetical protein
MIRRELRRWNWPILLCLLADAAVVYFVARAVL